MRLSRKAQREGHGMKQIEGDEVQSRNVIENNGVYGNEPGHGIGFGELARQAGLACGSGSSAARFVPRFPALGFTIFPEPDCDRTGPILRDVSFGRRMPVCEGLSRP